MLESIIGEMINHALENSVTLCHAVLIKHNKICFNRRYFYDVLFRVIILIIPATITTTPASEYINTKKCVKVVCFLDGAVSFPENPIEPFTETGYIRVYVTTAGGGLTVENALVTIRIAISEYSSVCATLTTDESGKIPRVEVPAPPRTLSLTPSDTPTGKNPYSLYNIEVTKDGYYPASVHGAQVFSGITSILKVDLVPIMEGESSDGLTVMGNTGVGEGK